ncbi:MAG: hypothetical protein LBE13_00355, partial [Bacteroidales bacterium]|nr:hypothetical protein [Bacteroidales bacterium]
LTDQDKNQEKELREKIRSNAGLENRFWIFPITAFASSFLTHLQCEGISLLTNKWYIYPPTNPIVTPVRFLRNLNEFIGMMVERSVYSIDNIKKFFIQTCEGWQTNENSKDKNHIDENKYVAFMGAEYRRFIQLYGSRLNIYRDKDVSLFAKSIWEQFYANAQGIENVKQGPDTSKLITLNFYMRRFFYASTYLTDDRLGKQKLRATWHDLKGHLENYYKKEEDSVFNNFDKIISKIIEE